MADNIPTSDRDDGDIDLAAKDIASVLYPRNIITDPSGVDQTLATQATLATLLTAAQAIQTATPSEARRPCSRCTPHSARRGAPR